MGAGGMGGMGISFWLCPRALGVRRAMPGDARAINMVREKVAQRARNLNDNSAAIQLRDALQLYDTAKNGKLPRATFREILERYSIYLHDVEFNQLCEPLTSVGNPSQIAYKPFLEKVLRKDQTGGAFGEFDDRIHVVFRSFS